MLKNCSAYSVYGLCLEQFIFDTGGHGRLEIVAGCPSEGREDLDQNLCRIRIFMVLMEDHGDSF
jgi:hypothetical protein